MRSPSHHRRGRRDRGRDDRGGDRHAVAALSLPLTVKGLIVTVIGGLGIPGAIIAGLVVGGLENCFQFFRGVSERDLYIMLLLFAFLVFRPGGLLRRPAAIDAGLAPMDFYLGLAQIIGVHTLLGLSAYCVLLTGQVSLAQAGFFAIGAYVAGMLTVLAHWPPPRSASPACSPACWPGRSARHCSGDDVAGPSRSARRCDCSSSISPIRCRPGQAFGPHGGEGFRQIRYFPNDVMLFIWAVVVLVMAGVWWLDRPVPAPCCARSARTSRRAELGINVTAVKVSAMTIGGVIAGIGGGLFAHYTTHIEHVQFGVLSRSPIPSSAGSPMCSAPCSPWSSSRAS